MPVICFLKKVIAFLSYKASAGHVLKYVHTSYVTYNGVDGITVISQNVSNTGLKGADHVRNLYMSSSVSICPALRKENRCVMFHSILL